MNPEETAPIDNVQQESDLTEELKNIHYSQNKFGSLTLFIVTIIIFFTAGIISTKWQEILILIVVLLIHESGHFLTMKLLKYQDVKMFFIPLLGAAVSGRPKRETALKSCLVSFMGPFPGIVLGAMLYILFGLTNNYYIMKTAQVMLLLNALNFLPIMPLDGGRFIDVLFINNRHFRLIFALLGASCFFALAASLKDVLLALIGVFSLVGAFSNFRIQGIARSIAPGSITATSVDELLDDKNQLQTVIGMLQNKSPVLFKPKVIQKAIYNNLSIIIDTVRFIPAAFITKVLLLMVYPLILALSIGVAIFFIAADVKETAIIANDGHSAVTHTEKHLFGKVRSRVPINESLHYNGTGIAYGSDTSIITDIFHYDNGFRTGEWLAKNEKGDTTEIEQYEHGRFVSVIKFNGTLRDTLSYRDFTMFKKIVTGIRERSQPVRSNYRYFE